MQRTVKKKGKAPDPYYLDFDSLLDKLIMGSTAVRNLRSVKDIGSLLKRIPTLDSTLCEKCRWQVTCPFYMRASLCTIVARVFLTEDRSFDSFKGSHTPLISTFVRKSTLLTNVQSSSDTSRLFAMSIILKRLESDALRSISGRAINILGYENNEVFNKKSEKSKLEGRHRHPFLATLFKDTKASKKGRISRKEIFRVFETR